MWMKTQRRSMIKIRRCVIIYSRGSLALLVS